MAYAYNRVLDALGKGQQDPQQSNIFQSQPDTGGAQPQGKAGNDRIQAADTSGSAAGVFNPSVSAAPAGGAPAATPQGSTTGARNRLFDKNLGKVKSPVDLDGLGSKVTGAQQAAQDEANNYVTSADDRYERQPSDESRYGLSSKDQNDLSGYIKTGDDRFDLGESSVPLIDKDGNQIAGGKSPLNILDAYKNGPGKVDDFTLRANTNFADVNDLGTDAGINNLFRRNGDAEYGANEAALDSSLLRKDAGFNQQRDAVLNQNRVMQDAVAKIRDNTRTNAQKQLDNTYSGWKDAVTNQLGSYNDQYEQQARDAEKEFDTNLGKYAPVTPWEGSFDYEPGIDAKQYLKGPTATAADTSWQDFVGQPEYEGFGRIMSLLGKGGPALTGPGKYAGKNAQDYAGSFDVGAYQKAGELLKAQQKASPFGDAYDAGGATYTPPFGSRLPGSIPPPVGAFDPRDPSQYGPAWNPDKSDPHNDPILPDAVEQPLEGALNNAGSVLTGKKKIW